MNDHFAGSPEIRKADAAAQAINNLLMDLVIRCTKTFDEGPRDYFDVGIVGYGSHSGVGPCFRGALRGRTLVSVSELASNTLRVDKRPRQVSDDSGGMVETTVRFPVWFDPVAEDGAPMREAMYLASKLLKSWVAEHPTSYPPIIINITGGEADTDPVAAAEELTSIRTIDGTVLVYNVHLSRFAIPPISFPSRSQELPDFAARALFQMSAVIPQPVAQELALEGYSVTPGARGFVFNADAAALIRFLDIGTRLALHEVSSAPNQDQNASEKKAKLFISYAHRDDRYRGQLVTHLAGLRWQGVIDDWHDRRIAPGKEWRDEIDQNLAAADCVLLLVSPDFLASDYCYSIEMQHALEKHRGGRALVIPVIVRPADWQHTPLRDLEALPKDAKPIVEWAQRDRAWLNVIEGIRRALWAGPH